MSCFLQGENECDDQTTADQATQAKMKNAFISQNVSSLQELGELYLLSSNFSTHLPHDQIRPSTRFNTS